MSFNLFILVFEDTLKNMDWKDRGININGEMFTSRYSKTQKETEKCILEDIYKTIGNIGH